MAVHIRRIIVDDLDQSTEGARTYRFALDDSTYEIDLCDRNIEKLRAALYPYIAAGRRQPKGRPAKNGNGAPGDKSSPSRHWWYAHRSDPGMPGYNPHGPIPQAVTAAFNNTATPQ
ncbi:Lsr2 family protein [Actinoplanes sp. Pm04-4]|uniref:Lsr2 family protein n=1 Tax=Paractinoplanes pyxinae TaxID=2997416 RepID=A0ABT4B4V0_9ACTN|nr:Lsr2 family protein [Actinoplanes pyxinae]MCY1141521.1 Lsr2 family protein [Actinoplanes pyxinae]